MLIAAAPFVLLKKYVSFLSVAPTFRQGSAMFNEHASTCINTDLKHPQTLPEEHHGACLEFLRSNDVTRIGLDAFLAALNGLYERVGMLKETAPEKDMAIAQVGSTRLSGCCVPACACVVNRRPDQLAEVVKMLSSFDWEGHRAMIETRSVHGRRRCHPLWTKGLAGPNLLIKRSSHAYFGTRLAVRLTVG